MLLRDRDAYRRLHLFRRCRRSTRDRTLQPRFLHFAAASSAILLLCVFLLYNIPITQSEAALVSTISSSLYLGSIALNPDYACEASSSRRIYVSQRMLTYSILFHAALPHILSYLLVAASHLACAYIYVLVDLYLSLPLRNCDSRDLT